MLTSRKAPLWNQSSPTQPSTMGFIGTATDWTCQFKPPGAWGSRDYDDRSWRPVDGPGVAGPPQEPKIFITPNAFVDLQAQAAGLRATEGDWPDPRGFFVYRHRFETR